MRSRLVQVGLTFEDVELVLQMTRMRLGAPQKSKMSLGLMVIERKMQEAQAFLMTNLQEESEAARKRR